MFRSKLPVLASVLLVSACGVETPEQAAAWDAHDAGVERAAALACQNTTSSYTATVGDDTCESFGTYAPQEPDGECPAGYSPGTATSGSVCDIAEDLLSEPGACPSGCMDGGVSEPSASASASSCTASKYRNCLPFAEPEARAFEAVSF